MNPKKLKTSNYQKLGFGTAPTSSGFSPISSKLDDDIMAGIVDDPDSDLRDILMLSDVEERRVRRQQQKQILDLVASHGGDARAYRRQRARKSRAIIAEFYSPSRISALAE